MPLPLPSRIRCAISAGVLLALSAPAVSTTRWCPPRGVFLKLSLSQMQGQWSRVRFRCKLVRGKAELLAKELLAKELLAKELLAKDTGRASHDAASLLLSCMTRPTRAALTRMRSDISTSDHTPPACSTFCAKTTVRGEELARR
jgi:hypothetical protein